MNLLALEERQSGHRLYTHLYIHILFGFQIGIQIFTIHVTDHRVWVYSPTIRTLEISP